MGNLRFEDVADLEGSLLAEQRVLFSDPDEAEMIGRRASSPITHTATWIALDRDSGELKYGPEVEIEVYRGQEKLLPTVLQEKLGMRDLRGWLFQVRESGPNANPRSFALLDGKDILLSKLPQSRNYFLCRTLKRCKHEKSVWARVEHAWDRHPEIRFAHERLDRILQEISVTPFVSFKECRAAWAIAPERFDVLGAERFDQLDDYTIAALDIPFEKACTLIRHEDRIQHALDLTDNGCLFHNYRPASVLKLAKRYGLDTGKGPIRLPVTEGLCENREELMRAAIFAALCGREVRQAGDSVAESALLLYHRFAYNFVDREKLPLARMYQASAELARLANPQGETPVWSEAFEVEQRAREFTFKWRELGPEAAKLRMAHLVNHVLGAPEGAMDQDFVATLRPAFAGWPDVWQKPEAFEKALERLKNATRKSAESAR